MEKQVYKNVLVGVDGSEQSDQAYKKALEVARRNDAHLVVVHIVEESDFPQWVIQQSLKIR